MMQIADTISDKYLTHPGYVRMDGRPYFSFYDLGNLIQQAGGLEQAARQIEDFRARVHSNQQR
jgi:hypothetical protein